MCTCSKVFPQHTVVTIGVSRLRIGLFVEIVVVVALVVVGDGRGNRVLVQKPADSCLKQSNFGPR